MIGGWLARRAGWVAATSGLVLLGIGCAPASPYLSGYSYVPQPAVAQVFHRGDTNQTPPLTVRVSIVGVRRADSKQHVPPAVVLRLRLENDGTKDASFDPGTLELVTGALHSFPRPQVSPPYVVSLPPGQRADVTATFPFPPGVSPEQFDMNNLRLRWTVRIDNYPVPQTALFERTGETYGGYGANEGYDWNSHGPDVAY